MRRKQPIQLIQSSALLLLASTAMQASAIEPAEVKLGESGIRMVPTVEIIQGYDDNVFATKNDAKSSAKFEVIPTLAFIAERQDSLYSVDFGITSATYFNVDDADYVNWYLGGDINEVFNSRNRLDVYVEVGTYSEDKSFEAQETLPEFDGVEAGILYGFGAKSARFSFDLYADYADKAYDDDNKSKDSTDTKLGGIGYVKVAPATKALLELRTSDVAYSNDATSDVEVTTALIGVTWEVSEKTTGYAKVGTQDQTRIDGESDSRPSWEVGVSWTPQTYSAFNFGTEQAFGLDSQSGDYSEYTDVTADWVHNWSSSWETKVLVSYKDENILAGTAGTGTTSAVGETLVTRELVEAGFDVTYSINRWSELSSGYLYSDRTAKEAARSPDNNDIYTRNYFYVGVELSL